MEKTQAFEKHEELTTFISEMASTGICPSGSNWTAFLAVINKVCHKANKYDQLRDEIETFYFDDEGNEHPEGKYDLIDIGEAVSYHFGLI